MIVWVKAILRCLVLLVPLAAGATERAQTPELAVTLVAETGLPQTATDAREQSLWLGVLLEHAPEWHTYWVNPGDSGLPTKLTWTLPDGVAAQEVAWPHPERFELSGLYNFGYQDRQLLPIELLVSSSYAAAHVPIELKIDWLVCKEECIPGSATLALSVALAPGTEPGPYLSDFAAARARWPTPSARRATAQIAGDTVTIEAELPDGFVASEAFDLFPVQTELLANVPGAASVANGVLRWIAPRSDYFQNAPERLSVVVTQGKPPQSRSWQFEAALVNLVAAGAAPSTTSTPTGPAQAPLGLGTALLFALLGGAVLNLMPCVFPVLALKALSLQGGAHPRHGMFYTFGVVASFLLLAGVLLALRASGEALGWGFQLQEPWLVALLAYLFFAMGLSLSGVFSVGERWMGIGQSLTDGESDRAAFFTGVLAAVVASPCTAPLMAAALGYALTQSAPISLSVFAALGFGLALPYLALTLSPALAARLPRPGPWMNRFKHFLAFPLYLSAVWLLWVFGEQQGAMAMGQVLVGAVALAMALWLFGSADSGRASIAVALLALGAGGYALSRAVAHEPSLAKPSSSSVAFDPSDLQSRVAAGEAVLVNMTAAWCITCLANERVALATDAVQTAMRDKGVTYVKGDWTRRDEAITRYLAQYQRTGVPLYVLYPGGNRAPQVLPQLLTPDIVLDALATVQARRTP
jgi:thiol:disulfide interchange protein DsbD